MVIEACPARALADPPLSRDGGILGPKESEQQHRLLFVAHTYQPPREFLDFSDPTGKTRADVVSWVNEERIFPECYKPVFLDRDKLPDGLTFSFYGSLREWMKAHHPQEFQTIREKINHIPDKKYQVLGDPYLHPILPLESEENQDMLVRIGKQAFEEDFGFTPKGFWAPETALSSTTLRVLHKNGYEFVVLRSDQLRSSEENPMYVSITDKDGRQLGEIAVIHFDPDISGPVSFPQPNNDVTANAEGFLHNDRFAFKKDYAIGTDTEFYGHHVPFKDHFLYYITQKNVLKANGFTSFKIKEALSGNSHKTTEIWENSSWSCPHSLGRWTGNCYCNTENLGEYDKQMVVGRIKDLHQTMDAYGKKIDHELDAVLPNWRELYKTFFLKTRTSMYAKGDIETDIQELIVDDGLVQLADPNISKLFKAQSARFTGETSCFGFFRDTTDRPEINIALINKRAIEKLVPTLLGLNQAIYQYAAD